MADTTPPPGEPAKKRPRKKLPPSPRPAHRPTKFSIEVQGRIIAGMQMGMSREDAANFAGISRSTLQNWLRVGETKPEGHSLKTFYDNVGQAFSRFHARHLQIINRAAKDDPNWSAWLLTHVPGTKELYALQQNVKHEGSVGITLEDVADLTRRMQANASDDDDPVDS